MNTLEFLNTELKEAGLNFKAYETEMQANGATADIGFEGDVFLNTASIRITNETLEISWFSGSRSDSSKALEFARIIQLVGAIGSKWETIAKHSRLLDYEKDFIISSGYDYKATYLHIKNDIYSHVQDHILGDLFGSKYPIYNQPHPKS